MRFIQHDCAKRVETGRKASARCVFGKEQKNYARLFLFSGRNLAFLKKVGIITQRALEFSREIEWFDGECCVFTKAWKNYATRSTAFYTVLRHSTSLHADLTAQVGGHQFFDGLFRVAAAEEVVQLGNSGFGGHIAAADGAGFLEGVAGRVDAELGRAAVALRADGDDGAVLGGTADAADQGAVVARDVAFAESLQDYAAELFGDDLLEKLKLDARKQLQNADRHLTQFGQLEFRCLRRHDERLLVVLDVDADVRQHRIVRRSKGHQFIRRDLGGTIAAQELARKVQTDLVDPSFGGNDHRVDEVVAAVAAQFAERDLGTGQNDGFAEAFEHERKR